MEFIKNFESLLSRISNISTIFISLAALVVSVIALRLSMMQPSLEISYVVHQSDNDMKGEYYKNGKGKLELLFDKETNQVSIVRPETSINLILSNNGKVSAKYPAIFIKFNGFGINRAFSEDWETFYHIHGIGLWGGIKWEPKENVILHPGIPKEFYELSFSGAEIIGDINSASEYSMDITIVADGFKAKKFNIPVEFKPL